MKPYGFVKWIQERWGICYFCLVSLVSLTMLSRESTRGHYKIFSAAALAFWRGQPPYGTDLGTGTELRWFYSPSCALGFYLPFAFLPEFLGCFLNVALMWLFFTYATHTFLRSLPFEINRRVDNFKNWFWFFITSEMISAIMSQKIEIIIVGTVFFALRDLLRGRRVVPALLLAITTNWKFQTLPIVGLISFYFLAARREIHFFMLFLIFIAIYSLMPFLFFSFEYLNLSYAQWFEAVNDNVRSTWMNFTHIYKILLGFIGSQDFGHVKIIGLLGIVFYLLFCGNFILRGRHYDSLSQKLGYLSLPFDGWGIMLCGALGSSFMVVFSPSSQSNGYM